MDTILEAKIDDFENIEGFGSVLAKSAYEFFY
ncbi:MAG: hypothetical protein E7542_00175 [Ruminococcaceae bacterium]|nr:hypothetical protein [Oscillospiraceae bacterium]